MIKSFDKKIETIKDVMNFIEYMKYLIVILEDKHPIRLLNKFFVMDCIEENSKVLRGENIES